MATLQVSQMQARMPHMAVPKQPATIIHCLHTGCKFAASARTEGRAIKALAGHITKVHHAEAHRDHL